MPRKSEVEALKQVLKDAYHQWLWKSGGDLYDVQARAVVAYFSKPGTSH